VEKPTSHYFEELQEHLVNLYLYVPGLRWEQYFSRTADGEIRTGRVIYITHYSCKVAYELTKYACWTRLFRFMAIRAHIAAQPLVIFLNKVV